jgi:broad specificity phosphatase PhoE
MNHLIVDDNVDTIILNGPKLPLISKGHKRLFLVRHGEVINPGGDKAVFYGALDVPLSELGKEEARAAASYLRQFELQHVAASLLKTRSLHTFGVC